MAHSNPEFALGLMQRDHAPVSHQARDAVSFRDLAARMAALPPTDPRAVQFQLGLRRIRDKRRAEAAEPTSLSEGKAGGMHAGGKIGERFVEPVPRGTGRRQRWAQS